MLSFYSRIRTLLQLSSFLLEGKELFLNVISNPVWYLGEQKKNLFCCLQHTKTFFAIDFEFNGVVYGLKSFESQCFYRSIIIEVEFVTPGLSLV